VSAAEAKARFDRGALFLDAREPESYRMGHIAGSILLPSIDFQRTFPTLEPQLRSRFDLVVYCDGPGCESSHMVANWLRERGIQVAIFVDGWPTWSAAGHPSRQGDSP
jgi:rhodanese-related sulfurtransferase